MQTFRGIAYSPCCIHGKGGLATTRLHRAGCEHRLSRQVTKRMPLPVPLPHPAACLRAFPGNRSALLSTSILEQYLAVHVNALPPRPPRSHRLTRPVTPEGDEKSWMSFCLLPGKRKNSQVSLVNARHNPVGPALNGHLRPQRVSERKRRGRRRISWPAV